MLVTDGAQVEKVMKSPSYELTRPNRNPQTAGLPNKKTLQSGLLLLKSRRNDKEKQMKFPLFYVL